MPRNVIAVGPDAVRKSLEILAKADPRKATEVHVACGAQWAGDRMLLSAKSGVVEFVAGNTLYSQGREEFLRAECLEGFAPQCQAAWLHGLPQHEMPFCMALAGELSAAWPGISSAGALLEHFGHFYRNQRPRIHVAERELRFIAEGMLALQHWPGLLEAVMDAIGEFPRGGLPKGLTASDLGALLGKLLTGTNDGSVTLGRVPECLRRAREEGAASTDERIVIPHYQRMLSNLERFTESLSPQLDQLCAAL